MINFEQVRVAEAPKFAHIAHSLGSLWQVCDWLLLADLPNARSLGDQRGAAQLTKLLLISCGLGVGGSCASILFGVGILIWISGRSLVQKTLLVVRPSRRVVVIERIIVQLDVVVHVFPRRRIST